MLAEEASRKYNLIDAPFYIIFKYLKYYWFNIKGIKTDESLLFLKRNNINVWNKENHKNVMNLLQLQGFSYWSGDEGKNIYYLLV